MPLTRDGVYYVPSRFFVEMMWIDVAQVESVKCTTEQFMSAVIVWLKKPHVVNRRLCGAELKWSVRVAPTCEDIPDIAIRLRTLINSALSLRLLFQKSCSFE